MKRSEKMVKVKTKETSIYDLKEGDIYVSQNKTSILQVLKIKKTILHGHLKGFVLCYFGKFSYSWYASIDDMKPKTRQKIVITL